MPGSAKGPDKPPCPHRQGLNLVWCRQRADQKRALVARLLVRACIHRALGLKWGQFEVKRTRGKKPFVATEHDRKEEAPNFNFNVAHEVRRSSSRLAAPCLLASVGHAAELPDLQGDYVVLAAEPLCLCGVDVAAPDTARGQKQTLRGIKETYRDVLTPKEVRLCIHRSCC